MEKMFKNYRRKQIAELRPVIDMDMVVFKINGCIYSSIESGTKVSISDVDLQNGSPKIGDMIARNPKNHLDQWLVAKDYFIDNFEEA